MTKFNYVRNAAFALLAGGLIVAAAPAGAHDRYHHRNHAAFTITLDGAQFGYYDGYYDNDRRWHGWRDRHERAWYRQNHSDSYYHMRRRHDHDRYRRDWREGRRDDWRGDNYVRRDDERRGDDQYGDGYRQH